MVGRPCVEREHHVSTQCPTATKLGNPRYLSRFSHPRTGGRTTRRVHQQSGGSQNVLNGKSP
jgi:hypothetical protein